MDTAKVGIREFRAGLAEYIASHKPVAITRHGQTVGHFIPTQGQAVAELAALKKAAAELDRLLAASAVDVEEGAAEFKAARRAGAADRRKTAGRSTAPDHAMTRRSIDLSGFFQGYSATPGLTGIVYPELLRSTIVPPGIVLLIAGVSLYPASKAAGLDPSRAIRHT